MSNDRKLEERLVLKKNEVFRAGNRFRGEIVGDRTIINLGAFTRKYKLGQAYTNIRNLEYRSEGKIKIQTFKEYLGARGDLVKLIFKTEEKPRPRFPSDEAYRNKKTKLHPGFLTRR